MERTILTDALKPGPDCLTIEQIGAYADGVLPGSARGAASAHLEACANCQAELALLRAFAATTVRDDEEESVRVGTEALRQREGEIFDAGSLEPPRARRRPWGWIQFGTSVAAVLLVFAGGISLLNRRAPSLPTSVKSDDVLRSATVAVRGPIGDQVTAPLRLEWRPVAGAVRYRARLMEVDRHELWTADVVATSVDLPSDVRARVVPAKTLLWQVTAYGASNVVMAESGIERFRLTPR